MAEPNTLYRVMILYMLDKVEYPLTSTQITDFILEKGYTNYFTVQETLSDLRTSELVTAESTHNNTRYRLTEEGKQSLDFFHDKISPEIKEEIDAYFRENNFKLKQETSVYADYFKAAGPGYQVHCVIKNIDTPVLDLTLTVQSAEQAKAICANWNTENADVYAMLMDLLLK